MPTPIAWFMSGILVCLGIALIVMALRARLRAGYGLGVRLSLVFLGGTCVCEAVFMLVLPGDLGLPSSLVWGLRFLSASAGCAMSFVAAFSWLLGTGIPINLPVPLRWYAWLLPATPGTQANHQETQDEFRPRR